jgi:hypothetical protein
VQSQSFVQMLSKTTFGSLRMNVNSNVNTEPFKPHMFVMIMAIKTRPKARFNSAYQLVRGLTYPPSVAFAFAHQPPFLGLFGSAMTTGSVVIDCGAGAFSDFVAAGAFTALAVSSGATTVFADFRGARPLAIGAAGVSATGSTATTGEASPPASAVFVLRGARPFFTGAVSLSPVTG